MIVIYLLALAIGLYIVYNALCPIITIIIRIYMKNRKYIDKIPGPHGYPLIGNLLEIIQPPEKMWSYCRELNKTYFPIYKLKNCMFASIGLQHPDDIEILLTSSTQIKKGTIYGCLNSWLGTGLLLSTGKKWQSRRKMLTSAFHFNILQQFTAIFFKRTKILLKRIQDECENPHTNIVPLITQFTLDSISETAMGSHLHHSQSRREEYSKAINKMADLLIYRTSRPWLVFNSIFRLSPKYKDEIKLLNVLHNFTKVVIENRKQDFVDFSTSPDDLANNEMNIKKPSAMLDILIQAKNHEQSIDDEGIREEVDTFMFEGHHTTTSAICFTLLSLACNPNIQDKVYQELQEVFNNSDQKITFHDLQNLHYLDLVLKESLRMYPSVPLITRMTTEDLHTSTGYTIPARTNVHIFIYDLHHNPRYFPEPEKFNPDRFLPQNSKDRHPFAYIPFSAGPRNCIGQRFAFLEIKIVIAEIIRNFKVNPIDRFEDLSMNIDFVLRSTNGIKMKFENR